MNPETNFDFFILGKVFTINYFLLSLRYFLISGLAFWIFWIWKKDYFKPYRIQLKFPEKVKLTNEIKYSMATFVVFSLVGVGIFTLKNMGITKIYTDVNEYGVWYIPVSLALTILIHDTYFYFAHRLMHHKLFFKKFHAVHHYSTNPSPWAAFSFHPYEAVLEAGILPIVIFLYPIHPITIVLFIFFMTGLNVLGHLGYELYPNSFVRNKWTNWNNTSTHHNIHHQKFNCNYGLYFNWWDKFFNTNNETYREDFERITSIRDNLLKEKVKTRNIN
jgi:Delta7-sterol 5-desaturase